MNNDDSRYNSLQKSDDSDTNTNNDDISDSSDNSDDEDNFASLGISMKDLTNTNLKTKDYREHYYHKKTNTVYSKSMETQKWTKPNKSQQKQLLEMFKDKYDDIQNTSSDSEDEKPKKKK